jgi:hypothetical protein
MDADEALEMLENYGVEPVGFLQFFNSWKADAAVRTLVTSGALVRAAQELLGCQTLRLYQVRATAAACIHETAREILAALELSFHMRLGEVKDL